MIVTNKNGKEIDFNKAVREMDPDVQDSLRGQNFASEQEFLTAYENKHYNLLGEEWKFSK